MTILAYAYSGQDLAIMGLGKSGMATARAVRAAGGRVLAWDDNPALREAARAEGVPLVNLAEATDRNGPWSSVRTIVWSPGIPHTHPAPHPVARLARERAIPLVCDIELLVRSRPSCFFVGITGTNGKSTTTALIDHIFRTARMPVQTGGNLGIPALALAPLPFHGTYVLELSSYQLELSPSLDCDVAILLNITPDHLARHGGMEGYVAAKERIFAPGQRPRTAVIGIDDLPSRLMRERLDTRGSMTVVPVSVQRVPRGGVGVERGRLMDALNGRPRPVVDLAALPALPGLHNAQNAAAAYAAARARGIDAKVIVKALTSFPGLPHRQERVATLGGVSFVNDSKATNADAADKALGCYPAVYWIAGGQPKEGGIASLTGHFPRIRHAFLIGEASEAFARTLAGQVETTACGTLERAVGEAARLAWRDGLEGAVVLLSPACASWDQFRSFEHRGEVFRALVTDLARQAPAGSPGAVAGPIKGT